MATFTANDIDITVTVDTEGKVVSVTDNTDYSSFDDMPDQFIVDTGLLNDPFGNVVFSRPSVGTPLIDIAGGDTQSPSFNMPLTQSSAILTGTYALSFSVNVNVGLTSLVVDQITVTTQEAEIQGDYSYLQPGDTVVFSGSSNTGNNGSKMVVSVTYDSGLDVTTVVFAASSFTNNENGSSGTVAAITINKGYRKTFNYSYTGCTEVTPSLTITSSCSDATITIVDTTNTTGQTVVSRSMSLTYPDGLVDPVPLVNPVTTSLASYTVGELANGTYTGILELDMSYVQTDELVVTYTARKVVEYEVACSLDLCCVQDCLDSLYNKFVTCSGGTNDAYANKVIQASFLVNQFGIQKECGNIDAAAATLVSLKDLLGSDCSCCESDEDVVSWVNAAISGLTVPPGTQTVIYFNETRITGTGIASNSFTNNPGFTLPANFAVGDMIELEIRAIYIDTGAEIKVRNTTSTATYCEDSIAVNDYGTELLRIIRTSNTEVFVIRDFQILNATPGVSVSQSLTNFAYNPATQNVINWTPDVPNDVMYYWIKAVHTTALA